MSTLPPHIPAELLDLNRPAQLRAAMRLYQIAGGDGIAVLTGGVRGWAEHLGCGRGYPKQLFAELEAVGVILGIEYYPGDGGQVAEVNLRRAADSITDPSTPAEIVPPDHDRSHQDAVDDPTIRSLIVSPHTPLYGTDHDLKQQQQCANPEPDIAPTDGADVWVAWAVRTYPNDPALIRAIFLHPEASLEAARNLFAARPDLTLPMWRAELAKAEALRHIQRPWGLAVSQLTVGKQIAPIRAAPTPLRRRREKPHDANAVDWAALAAAVEAERGPVEPAPLDEAPAKPATHLAVPPPPPSLPPRSLDDLVAAAAQDLGEVSEAEQRVLRHMLSEVGDVARAVRMIRRRRREKPRPPGRPPLAARPPGGS